MGKQGGGGFLTPLLKFGRLDGSFGVDERIQDREEAKNLDVFEESQASHALDMSC